MPPAPFRRRPRNEVDVASFQTALDPARLTLLGRLSHEAAPNHRGRLRLVVTRTVAALEGRADCWWWNPAGLPLAEALAAMIPGGGAVAVPGGQDIFDLIGADGVDEVPLARATRVRMGAGRGLFVACEAGLAARDVLAAGGLVADAPLWLDEPAGVSLTIWRRVPA
ncbi:hypothetical protein ACRC7T_13325 [Segnochrobactraceae bacterium EtOH-i3]